MDLEHSFIKDKRTADISKIASLVLTFNKIILIFCHIKFFMTKSNKTQWASFGGTIWKLIASNCYPLFSPC